MQVSPWRPGTAMPVCRGGSAVPLGWSAGVRWGKRSQRSRVRRPAVDASRGWRTPEERLPERGPDPFRHGPAVDGTKDRGSRHSATRHPPSPQGSATGGGGAISRDAGLRAMPAAVGFRQHGAGDGTNPRACSRARTRLPARAKPRPACARGDGHSPLPQGSARRSESTLAIVTASPVAATIRAGRPPAGSLPGNPPGAASPERPAPVARRHERLPVTAGHAAEASKTGMRPASGSVRTWTRMPPRRAPAPAGIHGARAGPSPTQPWTAAWKSQPAAHPAAVPAGERGREPEAGRSLSPRTTAPTLPRWIAPVAVASASARCGSSASAPPSASPTSSPGAHHA